MLARAPASAYQTKGPELYGCGYDITPVLGKAPVLSEWTKNPAKALEFDWFNGEHNAGVLTGGENNLIAIGIDVPSEPLAVEVEKILGDVLGDAPKRVGQHPKSLFVFRCDELMRKQSTQPYIIDGIKCQVEVLGDGQQFVAYGTHPKTKKLYDWPNDELTDYQIKELPEVSAKDVANFLQQADTALSGRVPKTFQAPPKEPWGQSGTNDNCIEQIKNGAAWHEPMLHLTGSYIARGLGRSETISALEQYTWGGFTVEQTREELGKMIDGALNKGFAPEEVEQPKGQLRTLNDLMKMKFEAKPPLHPWLTSGCMLLAGRPKAGKSLLVEHIVFEIAKSHRVLYLALEYGLQLMKHRFQRHMQNEAVRQNIKFLVEGDIARFDQGGAEELEQHLIEFNPAIIVIDTIGKFKRPGEAKGYEGETIAMSEIRLLVNKFNADLLAIHHTRKRMINDESDAFDQILGSTALSAVPDTLMVLEATSPPLATVHMKSRLLMEPREIVIELKDGEFIERTEAGASLIGKADVKADIVNLLEEEGPLKQKDIADQLGLKESNVSGYCKYLAIDRRIKREKRGSPWELIPNQSSLDIGV
jgi:hypothetical protein